MLSKNLTEISLGYPIINRNYIPSEISVFLFYDILQIEPYNTSSEPGGCSCDRCYVTKYRFKTKNMLRLE